MKNLTSLIIIGSSLFVCSAAKAENYITKFGASVSVGKNVSNYSSNLNKDVTLTLPSTMSNSWNCFGTKINMSDDGSFYFMSIICSNKAGDVVASQAQCFINKPDTDMQNMYFSGASKTAPVVMIKTSCVTKLAEEATPAAPGSDGNVY
jgi:hypothetical protein